MTVQQELTFDRKVPKIPLSKLQLKIKTLYNIEGSFHPLNSERDQCYRITTANQKSYVLKISNADEPQGIVDFQVKALEHIAHINPDLPVPRMVRTHENLAYDWIDGDQRQQHMIRLLTFVEGNVLEDVYPQCKNKTRVRENLGRFVAELGLALRGFFHPYASSSIHLWDLSAVNKLQHLLPYVKDRELRDLCSKQLDYANQYVYPELLHTRQQVIHQDAHQGNVLISPSNDTAVCGVIDFGDMLYGSIVSDIAIAADCYLENETDPVQVMCDVCFGYDQIMPLEDREIDLVYDMVLLRLINTVILINARDQQENGESEAHLPNTGKHGRMLKLMMETGRAESIRRLRSTCGFPAPSGLPNNISTDVLTRQKLLHEKRQQHLGDIWHFYDTPLNLVRGNGAYLYDADGNQYLDAYNNVPQVGHCHPQIVRTLSRQAATLNTNTRYLCDVTADYAERLLHTLPDGFDVCIFVNSGSEANDVAAQLACFASGNSGAIVMEDAYHGVTTETSRLSPLTFKNQPDNIECLPAPDTYRGRYEGGDPSLEQTKYDCKTALHSLKERGHSPAFFMVDSALCSNGVITPPEGYFEEIAQQVQSRGGYVIADEVQAGLGRLGQRWGFEAQGLASVDFITLGKPVGNGHPLGVVITRKSLWEPFNKNTELFSTFGGNTVSCAVGLSVMDVIERENLIVHAHQMGKVFRQQLQQLAERHPLIGDVRGKGLLTGLEFVTCHQQKTPATAITKDIVRIMKDEKVLVGSSGPHKNILKLRPPLIWSQIHIDHFCNALSRALTQLEHQAG